MKGKNIKDTLKEDRRKTIELKKASFINQFKCIDHRVIKSCDWGFIHKMNVILLAGHNPLLKGKIINIFIDENSLTEYTFIIKIK